MKQALHIFRKDVRHLQREIWIALAAVAGLSITVVSASSAMRTPEGSPNAPLGLMMGLLVLAWWALAARLIHAEPLAVEQPFWVTRPYSRRSLAAAKALFIVVFIVLPKFAADALVLKTLGFQIGTELGGLIWNQVLVAATIIVPLVAICCVTTGITQLLVVLLVAGVAAAGWELAASEFTTRIPWLALDWTRAYAAGLVLTAGCVAIIAVQYARRNTKRAWVMAGGTAVLATATYVGLPWSAAFGFQSHFARGAAGTEAIRAISDESLMWSARAFPGHGEDVEIQIPLRISGVPNWLEVRPEGIQAEIVGPDRSVWRAPGPPPGQMRAAGELTMFRTFVDAKFYEKVRLGKSRIRGRVYFTVYGNPRRTIIPVEATSKFHPADGAGVCSARGLGRKVLLSCNSSMKPSAADVTFDFLGNHQFILGALPVSFRTLSYSRTASYSPFPAEISLVAATQTVMMAEAPYGIRVGHEVRSFALEPVAYMTSKFDVGEFQLSAFEHGVEKNPGGRPPDGPIE